MARAGLHDLGTVQKAQVNPDVFEPFGQLVSLPRSSKPPAPAGAKLARAGIYLFWTLVAIVVIARAALGSHLFAFAS